MIAVIDQGIEHTHKRLVNCSIQGTTILETEEGTFKTIDNDFHDDSGHGTAVTSIIHKIVPNTKIFAIKLSSQKGTITEKLLVKALQYCDGNTRIKLINISMGIPTDMPSSELYDICKKISSNGVAIVAASHNFVSLKCFPAGFDFVYSVACGLVKSKYDFRLLEGNERRVLAKGGIQRIAWKDNHFKISSGTSYSAAHFSGLLYKLTSKAISEHRDDKLKSHSKSYIKEFIYIQKDPNLIASKKTDLNKETLNTIGKNLFTNHQASDLKKLALFPISEKETNTLVEFSANLEGKLELLIDYPKNFSNLLKRNKKKSPNVKTIAREPTNEEYESFETISVGYFMDIPVESSILFGTRLIINCVKRNKNFVIFDGDVYHLVKTIIKDENPNFTGQIFFPCIDQKVVKQIDHFKFLPEVKTPVLALIGTGSRQGKFTTQMRVKQILEKQGHKISFLSTEPQGILLNSAFVFPYGYNSSVQIHLTKWGKYLETIIRGIQHYNSPSLILTGIQGGILPRSVFYRNTSNGSILNSLHYLISVRPDAVICAINPDDEIDHIRQTSQTVYSYCKSPCLFYTMTPIMREVKQNNKHIVKNYRILNDQEMSSRLKYYSKELERPVINILDLDNENLVLSEIESFFSR